MKEVRELPTMMRRKSSDCVKDKNRDKVSLVSITLFFSLSVVALEAWKTFAEIAA